MSWCRFILVSWGRLLAGVAATASVAGCGLLIGLDDYERIDGPQPGIGGPGGGGGHAGTGGAGGSTPTDGWLRLAHMSPDSMGVDFCVTGSEGMARPSGYPASGVVYPGAGPYVAIPADTYQIGIIGAGMDCSSPVLTIMDFALAAGTYHTVIVDGLQATQNVRPYQDMNAPMMGNVYLNACHENSGAPPVQIGMTDANDMFISLFNDPSTITFEYQSCYSQEVPAPVAMGTVLAVSANGTDVDGRWWIPADLDTAGATFWLYGNDATDIGMYACINLADTCLALPVAN